MGMGLIDVQQEDAIVNAVGADLRHIAQAQGVRERGVRFVVQRGRPGVRVEALLHLLMVVTLDAEKRVKGTAAGRLRVGLLEDGAVGHTEGARCREVNHGRNHPIFQDLYLEPSRATEPG